MPRAAGAGSREARAAAADLLLRLKTGAHEFALDGLHRLVLFLLHANRRDAVEALQSYLSSADRFTSAALRLPPTTDLDVGALAGIRGATAREVALAASVVGFASSSSSAS